MQISLQLKYSLQMNHWSWLIEKKHVSKDYKIILRMKSNNVAKKTLVVPSQSYI